MSARGFEVRGIKELQRKLARLNSKVLRSIAKEEFRAAMAPTVARAKELAPVDTGALRDAIRFQEVKGSEAFVVSAGVSGHDFKGDTFYAGILEYGSKYIDAYLFMTQAYEETAAQVLATAERRILSRIEREFQ